MDAAEASQQIAVDTDNILGGGAGAQTNSQAMFGELSDRAIALSSSLADDEGQIDAIVNVYGSKNLLKNEMVGGTSNTIVFTVNANGSFSTSAGTPSANVNDKYIANGVLFKAGTYTFSGFPDNTGTDAAKVFLEIKTSWSGTQIAVLNSSTLETTFTLAQDTVLYIRPYFISGTTLPAMTFYPMIRDARIKDDTYVPYAPTNRDCVSYAANTVLGAHNLLNITATTKTDHGITYTIDANKIITVSGQNTSGVNAEIELCKGHPIKQGTYKLSGFETALSGAMQFWVAFSTTASGTYSEIARLRSDTTDPTVLNIAQDGYLWIVLDVISTYTTQITNYLVKPMICLASDTDPNFAPHSFTNRELTEVTEFTCTAGSGCTITFSACAKCGSIKMINLQVKCPAMTASTWYTVANIPAAYRSFFTSKNLLCQANPNASTVHFDTWVETDGDIAVRPSVNVGENSFIHINLTYI